MDNLIKLNDWKIRRFLIFVLSIQIAFWSIQFFDTNFYVEFILTLIYITFIPGVTLLRILRIYKVDNIETIVYSIGLSISMLMFIGLFMNTVYPFLGIDKPISIRYIIITLGLFTSILFIISFIRDKETLKDEESHERYKFMTKMSFTTSTKLVIILLISIFLSSIYGTYLANFYQDNFVLMLMISLIAITVILITTMNITEKILPISIFIISLSLLYHDALISSYITGWDIQTEYYLSNLVLNNSLWDMTIGSNVNAMLSIVMLAPIFVLLYNMKLIWIFKVIFPILFSLVPVGLFKVFQKQTNDKVAFLSCFYFMSMLTFYSEMISLGRQQIAELFLVLILVAMTSENINNTNKAIMYMIFGISLIVSHYGLSYIFLFSMIVIYLFFSRIYGRDIVSHRFIFLYIIFALTWYIYVADSSIVLTIAKIGNHIKESIFELFNPNSVEGMNTIVRKEVSPMREITKYLNIITQFFIMIGIFMIAKYKYIFEKMKLNFQFQKNYMNFSYTNMMILILGIIVPFVASSLNTTRLYHIALIFLAPFSIIGGLTLTYLINIGVKNSLTMLSIFFAIFLLFNTGFMYVIKAEPSASISLNYTADNYARFSESEVTTAIWIKETKANKNDSKVYSDAYRDLLLSSMIGNSTSRKVERNYLVGNENEEEIITQPVQNNYIFLGNENIMNGKMTLLTRDYKRIKIDFKNSTFYNKILNMSKIYDTGDTQILLR